MLCCLSGSEREKGKEAGAGEPRCKREERTARGGKKRDRRRRESEWPNRSSKLKIKTPVSATHLLPEQRRCLRLLLPRRRAKASKGRRLTRGRPKAAAEHFSRLFGRRRAIDVFFFFSAMEEREKDLASLALFLCAQILPLFTRESSILLVIVERNGWKLYVQVSF